MVDTSANFGGSVPEYYDRYLGPAWFNAYAVQLARQLPPDPKGDVLETACGTGIVTRRLREHLEPRRHLVATDLSKAMLDYARAKLGEQAGLEWREADAAKLPFADRAFAAVVCGFGVMFVPDRAAVFSEARRVLKKGGVFLFTVWDRLEENRHAAVNAEVIEGLFPGDPEMRFRAPFEMHDPALLTRMLGEAGFREVRIAKKRVPVEGIAARDLALGQIRGTPRSLLIEKRGVALDSVIEQVVAALTREGGDPYRGSANALVVEARA